MHAVATEPFDWDNAGKVPALPLEIVNHAVGTHNGALILAGGRTAAEEGLGNALDGVYVLLPGQKVWAKSATLGRPRMASAFASGPGGLYLAGGFDGQNTLDDVVRIQWVSGRLTVETLPARLPAGISSGSGAFLGSVFYVTGGLTAGGKPENTLWSLDTSAAGAAWQAVVAVPGLPRLGPNLIGGPDGLYLIGGNAWGASIARTATGTTVDDAYRYSPALGWRQIAAPPMEVRRTPSVAYGANHILLFGVGSQGDRNSIYAYHALTDTWAVLGTIPETRESTAAVWWDDKIVIPGGSTREHNSLKLHETVVTGTPRVRASGFGFLDYVIVGLYFAGMIGIGVYFSRREKSTEAFFLGSRRVPWWAVGLSIFGTSISSITYLSIPAKAYASNWVFMLSSLTVLLIAPFITRFYIPAFRRTPITTAYQWLEMRFNPLTRLYGSLVFLLFQIGRISIVLYLPAMVLSASTGLSIEFSVMTMGIITTFYTVAGGIEAVIWTDVIQAFVLVGGALLALFIAVAHIDGGWSGLYASASAANKFEMLNWQPDYMTATVYVCVLGNFFALLYPSTADQTIVQRYLATASEREARRAVWTNTLLSVPVAFFFFGLGTALWVYFKAHPEKLDPSLPNDAILPLFVMENFPVGLRSTLIAGVFAAAMSSLSSSMNSMSAVLVNDYLRPLRPRLLEQDALRAARGITLVIGVFGTLFALVIAKMAVPSLFDQWLKWLNLIGGGLAGIVALGVFTRRAHGRGALVGIVAGAIAVYWIQGTRAHFFLHGMAGFLAAYTVGYFASLVLPRAAARAPQS